MNFIDISNWQNGIDLAVMFKENPLDGVIIKATEATGYTNPNFKTWAEWLTNNNKLWGTYHFCAGADAVAEAEYFYSAVKRYIGKCVPVADYEGDVLKRGTGWLKEFLDGFYRLSKVRPLVYCSQSVTQSQNFREIANAGYGLWVAQYADYNPVYGFIDKPWQSGSVSPFPGYHLHQYTSSGVLKGWRSYLDFDKFFGTADDWKALCGSNEAPTGLKGPDALVVNEVLSNKYETGEKRRELLTKAGYDPDRVQAKVNDVYAIAEKCAPICAGNREYMNSIVKLIKKIIKE